MKFRNDINGLRALAVIGVLFYHSKYLKFESGFLGVDIFFVISGYLITRLILKQIDEGIFSLKNFYIKRYRRLVPALNISIIFSLILFICFYFPYDLNDFKESLIYTIFFLSNFYFWRSIDYFNPEVETELFAHTWSLGIEEQFYILLPVFLLMLFYFKLNEKIILFFTLALATFSFYLCTSVEFLEMVTKFYLLPMRFWELAFGVIAALLIRNYEFKKNNFVSLLSFFLLIYSLIYLDIKLNHPGFGTLIPVFSTFLLIIFNSEDSIISKIFEIKIFQILGLASYSIYLIHYPLFAINKYWNISEQIQVSGVLIEIVFLFLSIVLGIFSWRFVETPYRDENLVSNYKLILHNGVISLILVAVVSSSVLNDIVYSINDFEVNFDTAKERSSNPCLITNSEDLLNEILCLSTYEVGKANYLLIGESVANDFYFGLKENISSEETISLLGVTGCVPLVTEYNKENLYFNEKKCVKNYMIVKDVINKYDFEKIIIFFTYSSFENYENNKALDDTFLSFTNELKKLDKEKIRIVGQPVIWNDSIKRIIYREYRLNSNFDEYTNKFLNQNIFSYEQKMKTFSENEELKYFSIIGILCLESSCKTVVKDGNINYGLFVDKIHMSQYTVNFLAKSFLKLS